MRTFESMDRPNAQISDEAAEWFVELNGGEPDHATRKKFDAWLRRSPEHVSAYLDMFSLWEDAALVPAEGDWSADSLIALSRASGNVVPLEGAAGERTERADPDRRRPYRSFVLGAFALCACMVIAVFIWSSVSAPVFETEIGEQRVVSLADGSSIELNARSRVRIRFNESERNVDLLEGQALFRVAKDKNRPFIVQSGTARVRAVGTQFDVYKKKQGTVVTVLEGRVSVLSASEAPKKRSEPVSPGAGVFLSAGEQATVAPAETPRAEVANVAAATAWRARRMVFNATPLTEVAEEFNRYNERQLVVDDARVAGVLVNGIFSSTDPASLIRFLRAQPDLSIEEKQSEIRILGR